MKRFDFKSFKRSALQKVNKNSPKILTAASCIGMTGTIILTAKVAPKAKKAWDDKKEEIKERRETLNEEISKPKEIFEEVKAVTPYYLPVAIMGGTSIACSVGSYKISAKRITAYASAYEVARQSLVDYKAKTKEVVGEKKEKEIEGAIAADKVKENPPSNEVIMDDGLTLCYDAMSGRYFRSSAEKIRQVVNELNKRLITEMYVSMNDLYYELGIPSTRLGDEMGWNVDDMIEVNFNSILAPNDEPCLVLDYSCCPRYDFRGLM